MLARQPERKRHREYAQHCDDVSRLFRLERFSPHKSIVRQKRIVERPLLCVPYFSSPLEIKALRSTLNAGEICYLVMRSPVVRRDHYQIGVAIHQLMNPDN